MYTGSTLQLQPLDLTPTVQQASPIGAPPPMTPFVEIPLDPAWREMVRATIAAQPEEQVRLYFNGRTPTPRERLEHIERAVMLLTPIKVFQNNLYRVELVHTPPTTPTFTHLSIMRLDGGTCNEWSHLQTIKNEIVGPEYEAIELFPAESRLVNTGNQYHLWVHSDPAFRFPLGWSQRMVFSALPIVGPAPAVHDNTGATRPAPETFTLRARCAA
jgi:hypothetical protein